MIVTCPRCGVEADVQSYGAHGRIIVRDFDFICAELPPIPPGGSREIRGDIDKCPALSAAIQRARES